LRKEIDPFDLVMAGLREEGMTAHDPIVGWAIILGCGIVAAAFVHHGFLILACRWTTRTDGQSETMPRRHLAASRTKTAQMQIERGRSR
jgi:hypothetical protein